MIRINGKLKHTKEEINKISLSNIKTHKERNYGFKKGRKVTIECRRKMSIGLKNKIPWNKGLTKEINNKIKKHSEIMKKRYENGQNKNMTMTGKNHSDSTKLKMRKSAIKYIEKLKLDGLPFVPRVNRFEKEILDKLENSLNLNILRQYKSHGYFLDGYCPSMNLAIEIDEPHHYSNNGNLNIKDIERQRLIEQRLKCDFLRIKIPKEVDK